jgi:5-(carboxyamino)imidazole ribonucleotide synthase
MLPPGSTLGVLGNGQLGRMFAMAAERLGYKVIGFGPDADSPLSQVCSFVHCASYDDENALAEFAGSVDVVTIEFENIPSRALEFVAQYKPVYPGANVLHVCQHRLREKEFLSEGGFPVTPFAVISVGGGQAGAQPAGSQQLPSNLLPAIIKTTGFGYDGKGQRLARNADEAKQAIVELTAGGAGADDAGGQVIVEQLVNFEKEISVIGARAQDGKFAAYGPIENKHANHILDVSCLPARVPAPLASQAIAITQAIMEALDVIGLLCVEFFVTADGRLLVNELAPRPHNSGHLTIEGCAVSQFEQLVRIICGLPLGATESLAPTAMANLLGDLWSGGEPGWTRVLNLPSVYLHLYGKAQAKPGRKMGHITARGDSVEEVISTATEARSLLY